MKKLFAVLSILILAVALTSCSGKKSQAKLDITTGEIQFSQPAEGDTVATITTSEGIIKVLLFPNLAPKRVENFIQLAQQGYYDGLTFHRAVKDFVIQSGSPDGSINGGMSVWGRYFTDEYSDLLHNYTGAIAYANHGANTNGSQFYFVVTPVSEMSEESVSQMESAGWRSKVIESYKQAGGLPQLDYRCTVFGQIYEGLNVAFDISNAKTDDKEKPVKDITITSVEVFIIGDEENN